LRSGSPLLVAGHRVSIVGRVSMDMVAVDVTDVSGVSIGVPAILWGPELPVEEVARSAGTIPWELLCAVSQRVPVVRV
jgi:alanine racemase